MSDIQTCFIQGCTVPPASTLFNEDADIQCGPAILEESLAKLNHVLQGMYQDEFTLVAIV